MNLIEDLAALSSVNEKLLNKLSDLAIYSISNTVNESLLENKNDCIIELGIGKLVISFSSTELKFKFLPDAKLKGSIINTIKSGNDNFEYTLDAKFAEKLEKLYKEIL